MPAYNAATAPVVEQGRPSTVWSAEAVSNGGKSQQVSFHRRELPGTCSVEVEFSGDPGAFSIDLQTADTDADKYYVTKTTLSAVNSSFVGRLEVPQIVAKFARLVLVSKANAVNVTAKFF
jgi:hypothetical protein